MSECHRDPQNDISYNRQLHLAGVAVILTASTLGVFMPLIATRFRTLCVPHHVLTLGKQFGTGIILATAFIHMLPTAMSNLSSPCLGPTFSENYQAFGGLLVLTASLLMHWIEFMAMEHTQTRMKEAAESRGLLKERGSSIHMDLGGLGATGVAAAPCPVEVAHTHAHGLELLDASQRRISTYILEGGVASHSVIIGVALGVSSDSEFTGLLIALVFHQFFEGFALGARINDLDFERTTTHYLLALIFSLTTPIGAMIGIVVSSSYDPTSVTAILTEGVFDAISTGILLYMGYVNLLAVEFNMNGEIRQESTKVKAMCFLALWMGVAVMAVIGRFA
ncbi:high-affinity Zn(2+) transporter zrt1 [Mortierella sp. GBA30]|nr:high-affinity Zn(2+) transporter zrt1 [Mortierella sp. GBA30]